MPFSESRQLVSRAECGDRTALDALFSRETNRLRRLLRLHAGPTLLGGGDVDDLVQEAYLEAVRQFDAYTYQGRDSFFRWLATVALHRLQNLRRSNEAEKRDVRRSVRLNGPETAARVGGPTEANTPVRAPGPRTMTASGEEIERLENALGNLAPQDREVILLARVEGLPLAEVAERMGRTKNAVALLLSRALRKLGKSIR